MKKLIVVDENDNFLGHKYPSERTYDDIIHVPALAFKYPEFQEASLRKEEAVREMSREESKRFRSTFKNPLRLAELEDALHNELGVNTLVSVLPDPEKVKPTDVPLYDGVNPLCSLRDRRPRHYESLEEQTEEFFAVRVLVPQSERSRLRKRADEVSEVFREEVKRIEENSLPNGDE
ncbi:MAG: hypothetical protein ACE5FT_06370 [Candidatus Nanoarchaeia archaeon]